MATDLEQLRVQLSADTRRYEASMRAAANETNRSLARIERRFRQTHGNVARSAAQIGRTVTSAFAGIATALAVREVIRAGDAWAQFGNQLRAVELAVGRPVASLDQLVEVAMRSRTSLESTVTLYTRLERAGAQLGRTQAEMLSITETINQAFIAGGASAQEQASAILQLSQAIASGALQGDELRSIRESAPLLAQAIADSMGVSIGALRDLGAEGQITAEVILGAIENMSGSVSEQVGSMSLTVSQAMNNLRTATLQAVGGADAAAGGTSRLAEAIDQLARTIQENRDGIESFMQMMVAGASGVASVIGSIGDFMTRTNTEAADMLQQLGNEVAIGQTGGRDEIFRRLRVTLADEDLREAQQRLDEIFDQRTYLDRPGELDPLGVQQLTEYLLGLARGYREAAAGRRELTGDPATGAGGSGAGAGTVTAPAAGIVEAEGKTAEQIIKNATTELEAILQAADAALASVREEAADEKSRLGEEMLAAWHDNREQMRDNFRQSFSSGVSAALLEGEDGLQRWFANAAHRGLENALNRLADQLFDLFSQAGGGGGGGGFFSSLLGGLFGGGKAYGGPVQAGQSYMVGERGPERFVPSTNGVIVPRGPDGGGMSAAVSVTNSFTIDARGATPDAVAALRGEMRAVVGGLQRSIPATVEAVLPGAVRKAQKDGRL